MSEVSSEIIPTLSKSIENRGLNSDSHSVQITSIRLNGDNFLRWSQSVRMYIRGRGKIGYLTGDIKAPDIKDTTYATWDAENSMVMAWLVNSMDEDIASNYMCYSTAKELWDNISQMYSDLGNQSQVYELQLKLGEIQQGGDNITKYFNILKRLWQDLDIFNDYEWKSPEDCHHHKKMVENDRIYKFLAGLNVGFDEVRGRIIGRGTLPSLGEVFAEVRREESRRSVMLGKNKAEASIENSALVTADANASRAVNNQRRAEDKTKIWCDICSKPRHTRETCWKLHGKPANWKSNKPGERYARANEADAGPFSKEQMNHLLKLLKSNPQSGIPSVSLAQTGSNFSAFSCYSNPILWIIDSGASNHMTKLSHEFLSYSPCSGDKKVRIADGKFSSIAGKGSIKISQKITLKSVLHVPNLACNLLSVSQLSKDSNCRVTFFDSHCEFQDMSTGTMIGSARMVDGLYYFDDNFLRDKQAQGLSTSISSLSVREQIMIWHLRLGHPSFSYLKYLFPDLFKTVDCSSFQCESCILSKSHRTTYSSKPYCSSKPFYLIHSDVWGPSKITTSSGKKWFVTFIDDHTRLCWVYLMKDKTEVENLFKIFYNMVENQFQTRIQILHSDNGTEYFKQVLGNFLKEKGIQHQSTCSDTPQQNGIAERKNRHLLEVARAIMFSMHVPKYLWGDAILTACYLINRMPTRVFNYMTPLECLKSFFPECRLFSDLPLKIFGCTVFVHIPSRLRSKLDPRAEKCVFIGYAPNKRGYKCYNPQTKKFFVSMDVLFVEKQPYFKQNCLQGEIESNEAQFWETATPLPNTFFPEPVLDTPSSNQEIDIHNIQKKGNTSLPLPNLDDSQIEKEILGQDHINPISELRVYTRRDTHKKGKDLPTTLAQDQPLSPSNGPSTIPVFDCCFTTDASEEQDYKGYVGGIVSQLRENYPDASILAFNFREGETQSQIGNALSEYDMTIMEYPRQYEGCPLLPMEVIHHFLRSSESWLSLGLQNLLLMHCERGGWPVLAFMLAALLIYRKHYSGELKTLDMVYKQAPRELLHLLSPLNPIPSQLRYLQYVSRRNVATQWPPLDRALTMDCVIIRMIPDFDGEGGCRPIFRIYGQDPFLVSDRAPRVLFSTPKKSRNVRHYKQAECEIVKVDINCHIQGDVVLECINLHDDTEREVMMFRVMFNTAFIRSNILMLNRDEIDVLWDAKDLFPKDFRAEVIFSETDTAASTVPVDCSCFEEKDGLPVEAFAKVQEIFSSVDWLVPKGDAAVEILQHLSVSDTVIEAYSYAEKSQVNQTLAALKVKSVVKSPTELTFENQSNLSPKLSPNADVGRNKAKPHFALTKMGEIISSKQTLIPSGDHSPPSSTSPHVQLSIAKTHFLPKQQSDINAQRSGMVKDVFPPNEAETSYPKSLPSTRPTQPTKDADIVPGRSLFSPATSPLTPPLEDKIGFQSGVPPIPLLPSEIPSASTLPWKDDVLPGISSPSAESPRNHDQVIGDGPPKSEPSPLTASSTKDMIEAPRVAPPPPPPPPPPLMTHSSSVIDVGKSTRFGSSPLPTTPSSDLNAIQATGGGSPSPHLSSPKTDVTLKTAPLTSPPPDLYVAPIKENSASTHGPTPPATLPSPISPLKVNSACGVGPPLLPTFMPHITDSLANRPASCPSPPPLAPPHESSSVRSGPPLSAPPPPPPPPPPISPLKEHYASGVVPPLPLTPPLRDNSVARPAPAPAPPPPPPPSALGPPKERSSGGGPPPPPPPPPSPHSGHGASPLTPPLRDSSVARPAPNPPPPPPQTPKERSGGGGPPLPSPPLHSGQGAGPTNPPTLAPPHPPPAPANCIGPSTRSSPSVPLAPPSPSGSRGNSLSGSPSPPPPSVPPPGTKGKSLLSRTVTSRNNQTKKLKPLHWLKISRAVSGSLWAEAQKSGEASKAPEIDISELESLFSAAVPNPDQGGSGRKTGSRASMGHKPEKVQLIEHRRAYNCEIMLSKVKIPLHDMLSSVLALEDSALDVDQVDNLIKFCPTKEEMDVLKGYKGEKDKLGKCEQFFLELMQVPRIEHKLRVFSFKIQFHSQVSDLRNSLNVVNSAADQIKGSAKLKRIMQTILSLGNALNQGTARGSAVGFRLDSLLKLTETRARNNKMTLMHYLCKVLSDKLPELLDFWKDLSSLEFASKIQLKFLAEEMQAINKGLEKVVQELSMSESDGPVSDQFYKALKEFLCFSEGEVRSMASLYAGVGRNVDSLILYFGEDPSRCPFEQVISTLLNFVRMFKQAHEENCKQLEFERKKAEKEASEKMKINASDTGHLLQSQARSVK